MSPHLSLPRGERGEAEPVPCSHTAATAVDYIRAPSWGTASEQGQSQAMIRTKPMLKQ